VGNIPGVDPNKGKEVAGQAWDTGKFKVEMDRFESALSKVPADKMGIKEGESSELVTFMQRALKNLGQSGVTVDGKVTPEFLQELNGYIKAKQGERDIFGSYKDLKEVTKASEISGAHLQAIIDTLRDQGKIKADSKEVLDALGKAMRQIDDPAVKEMSTKLAPPPAQEQKKDDWGAKTSEAPSTVVKPA
jgi:hypothetical protein